MKEIEIKLTPEQKIWEKEAQDAKFSGMKEAVYMMTRMLMPFGDDELAKAKRISRQVAFQCPIKEEENPTYREVEMWIVAKLKRMKVEAKFPVDREKILKEIEEEVRAADA